MAEYRRGQSDQPRGDRERDEVEARRTEGVNARRAAVEARRAANQEERERAAAELRRPTRLDQPREPHRVRLPRFDPEALGRWSEDFARFLGTARFIVYMT